MNILAALDQSEHAEGVLKAAVAMAKAQGAELTIITVAEDYQDMGDFYVEAAEITRKALQGAREAAAKYVDMAKAMGVAAKVEVPQGLSPAEVIIQFAEGMKPDLIVMGSRGRGALERFLVGSVAAKVVNHAPCSVLVVR